MSRRVRMPRPPRVTARRNTSAQGTPVRPSLVLFPVNPLSVKGSLDQHNLSAATQIYAQRLIDLARDVLQTSNPKMLPLDATYTRIDESRAAEFLLQTPDNMFSDTQRNLRDELRLYLGYTLESEAAPPASFGILSEKTLQKEFPEGSDPINVAVETLWGRIERSASGGSPVGLHGVGRWTWRDFSPLVEIGSRRSGWELQTGILISAGQMDQQSRIGDMFSGTTGRAAAYALLRTILISGLYDFERSKWRGKVLLALPSPEGRGGIDTTGSQEVARTFGTYYQTYALAQDMSQEVATVYYSSDMMRTMLHLPGEGGPPILGKLTGEDVYTFNRGADTHTLERNGAETLFTSTDNQGTRRTQVKTIDSGYKFPGTHFLGAMRAAVDDLLEAITKHPVDFLREVKAGAGFYSSPDFSEHLDGLLRGESTPGDLTLDLWPIKQAMLYYRGVEPRAESVAPVTLSEQDPLFYDSDKTGIALSQLKTFLDSGKPFEAPAQSTFAKNIAIPAPGQGRYLVVHTRGAVMLRVSRFEDQEGVQVFGITQVVPPLEAYAILAGVKRRIESEYQEKNQTERESLRFARDLVGGAQGEGLREALRTIPLGFYAEADESGFHSYLPAFADSDTSSQPSWFGAPAHIRFAASRREGFRRRIAEKLSSSPKKGPVPSVSALRIVAAEKRNREEVGDIYVPKFVVGSKDDPSIFSQEYWRRNVPIQVIRKALSDLSNLDAFSEAATDLDPDDTSLVSQEWRVLSGRVRRDDTTIPLVPSQGDPLDRALHSAVFTLYGLITVDTFPLIAETPGNTLEALTPAERERLSHGLPVYGPIWQGPVMDRAEMARIAMRRVEPVVPDTGREAKSWQQVAREKALARPQAPVVPLPIPSDLAEKALRGEIRVLILSPNQVKAVVMEQGDRAKVDTGNGLLAVRYRGPQMFGDVVSRYGGTQALADAEFGEEIDSEAEYMELLSSRPDSRARRAWATGEAAWHVFDVSNDPDEFDQDEPDPLVHNPSYGLRLYLSEVSGLIRLTEWWAGFAASEDGYELPVPFALVGAMALNKKALMSSAVRQSTKPLLVGDKAALYLTHFIIPSKDDEALPALAELTTTMSTVATPKGLRVSQLTVNDTRTLLASLAGVSWERNSGSFLPLIGSTWGSINIFSLSTIKKMPDYPRAVQRALQQARKKMKDLSDDEFKAWAEENMEGAHQAAYHAILATGLTSRRGSGRQGEVIEGGRQAYLAIGGSKGRAKRVGSELRSPSEKEKQWATDKAVSFYNVAMFAARICKETGVCRLAVPEKTVLSYMSSKDHVYETSLTPEMVRTIQVSLLEDDVNQGVSLSLPREALITPTLEVGTPYTFIVGTPPSTLFVQLVPSVVEDDFVVATVSRPALSPVIQRMVEMGINPPALDDLEGNYAALLKLRDELRTRTKIKPSQGTLPKQLGQIPVSAGLSRTEILRDTVRSGIPQAEAAALLREIGAGDMEFEQGYLDLLSRENPRRSRRPRKPRPSDARRNPLPPSAVQQAVQYADKGSKADISDLDAALRDLDRKSPPGSWPVSPDAVRGLFPSRKQLARGETWSPAKVLPVLERYDAVARVGAVPPNPEQEFEAMRGGMPFESPGGRERVLRHATLSLNDTLKILAAQKEKPQRGTTIPASTALCKLYKTKRLSSYELPAEVTSIVGGDATLIWLSPLGAPTPRVMTFRRGSHLDCDMKADDPRKMPELLGRAIQSSLYWLAEKDSRRMKRTRIYVGRVGSPELFLAWAPGQALTLNQVMANLAAGTSPQKVQVTKLYSEAKASQDAERYAAALAVQFPREGSPAAVHSSGDTPHTAEGTPPAARDDIFSKASDLLGLGDE